MDSTCKATIASGKRKGQRCTNNPYPNSIYCGIHMKDKKNEKKTKKPFTLCFDLPYGSYPMWFYVTIEDGVFGGREFKLFTFSVHEKHCREYPGGSVDFKFFKKSPRGTESSSTSLLVYLDEFTFTIEYMGKMNPKPIWILAFFNNKLQYSPLYFPRLC